MYRVYCDGLTLYNSNLESLKIFSPSVELELNKTGSFLFTVYPDHPQYNTIQKLRSIITVYQDDYLLFRGRVLDDEIGFHNEKHVTCEGELAFLLDSVQRPYDYSGTVAGFLNLLIDNHNAQVETDIPMVLTTAITTVPGTSVSGNASANITATGFEAYVTRNSTTSTSVGWIAVGYKSKSE